MRGFRAVLCAAVTTFLGLTGAARGASLFFQLVNTPITQTCRFTNCYELRVFFEDPTRDLAIRTLDLYLDFLGGASLLPFRNPGSAGANIAIEDADGNGFPAFPWAVINQSGSPQGVSGFPVPDAGLLAGASAPLTINSVQATLETFNQVCLGLACSIHTEALAANRLYLGRIKDVVYFSGAVGIQAWIGLTGQPATDDPVEGIARLNGSVFDVDGFPSLAPEPGGSVLVGAGLIALLFRRTSLRGRSHDEPAA